MVTGYEHKVYISIHAPPRGATAGSRFCGNRPAISIHAPPRGATIGQNAGKRRGIYFNSRPSARGDQVRQQMTTLSEQFQFTPLREGRQAHQRRPVPVCGHFNSRPSARGDLDFEPRLHLFEGISIHAPPRGATCVPACRMMLCTFQFTPLREGRRHYIIKER